MVPGEHGPAVPELARRATASSCRHDPVRALVPVLTAMPAAGIPLGDVLADSGYAHRDAGAWALPLRAAGAALVQDLHPHDRGPKGTHDGAIISNGHLYCPVTPRSLRSGAARPRCHPGTGRRARRQDRRAGPLQARQDTRDDEDGYHRVQCPAAMGKTRCPLRPASMRLDRDRSEILTPPEHPQACCTRQPSPSRPRSPRKPRRNTTTPPPRTAAPTPAAPAPNAASPPPRTPPATTSAAAVPPDGPGPADAVHHDPAHRPQPAHPRRLERPPGREHARAAAGLPPKTRRRRRKTLNGSPLPHGRPSQASTPAPGNSTPSPPGHQTDGDSLPQTTPGTQKTTTPTRTTAAPGYAPNVRPKREDRPHQNVKTSLWSYGDSNPRPLACHGNAEFQLPPDASQRPPVPLKPHRPRLERRSDDGQNDLGRSHGPHRSCAPVDGPGARS